MFIQIFLVIEYLAQDFIKLVTLDQCLFSIVYGLKFPIKLSENLKEHISSTLHYFSHYISPVITWASLVSVIFPLLAYLIWKCSSKIIKNRMTPIRYTPVYEGYNGNTRKLLLKVHSRKHFLPDLSILDCSNIRIHHLCFEKLCNNNLII